MRDTEVSPRFANLLEKMPSLCVPSARLCIPAICYSKSGSNRLTCLYKYKCKSQTRAFPVSITTSSFSSHV